MSVPTISTVKEKHRAAARMLVMGMSPSAVGAALGYTPETIRKWKSSPLMEGLLEYYGLVADDVEKQAMLHRASLGIKSVAEMHRRLDENPEEITVRELTDIMKNTIPAAQEQTTNIVFADRLSAARARVAPVIEGEVIKSSTVPV